LNLEHQSISLKIEPWVALLSTFILRLSSGG